MMNSEVLYHFKMWQKINPKTCKCTTHYQANGEPLSDESVCLRERFWRNYVKARDKALLGITPKPGRKTNLGDLFQAFDED